MDRATLQQLLAEIDALKARNRDEIDALKAQARARQDEADTLKARFAALETAHRAAARASRRRLAAATLAAGLAIAWSATPEARAQFGLTLAGLNARLTAVEARTAPLSVNGTTLTIGGVNVQIVDGSGSTNSFTGLGNLTVGYNQLQNNGNDARTGSHNLILGDLNNYTGYGGFVAGEFNMISAAYATVSGGQANVASGYASSVSGGGSVTASNYGSSISGGYNNTASGQFASVSGGLNRKAPNTYNWVAGGTLPVQ